METKAMLLSAAKDYNGEKQVDMLPMPDSLQNHELPSFESLENAQE